MIDFFIRAGGGIRGYDVTGVQTCALPIFGPIEIGENIVLIVAAGEHRKETFVACEWAIAELKRTTPIWKRETTSKGEVWVQDTP